jgi:hypothetical protein
MWLAEREAELLPVEEYFHVVFTLPQQLAALALQNAKTIYTILFRSVAETMLTIAADPQHLVRPSAFWPCFTPGVRISISIRMFIAWYLVAESAPTTHVGSPVESRSSFPSRSSVLFSAGGS